ncbi:MAG: hypothetical protein U5K00_15000 [Melioribacteraceae bacterium]|nr:hypothetical protein [Melioribacteraceae bacterium]
MNNELRKYSYKLEFEDGKTETFNIFLEPSTLQIVRQSKEQPADWTKLENFECDHCPINKDEFEYCPVAVNLEELIKFFSERASYEKVKVTVETEERSYYKETDLQSAVGSLMGILMPASGCPILAKLRPMLRFHLPFSDLDETEFRVFAMFSLAQFLRHKKGKEPDWEMKSLAELYDNIQKINTNVAKQISELEKRDASINSVIVLNNLAAFVSMNLDEEDFSNLSKIFSTWISE